MNGEHKETENRYTIAFFVLVIIILASVLAVTVKSLIVWFSQ